MTINETKEKLARAKRADINSMQERFDAILMISESMFEDGREIAPDLSAKIRTIEEIADGASLDSIIQAAGRKALGLQND